MAESDPIRRQRDQVDLLKANYQQVYRQYQKELQELRDMQAQQAVPPLPHTERTDCVFLLYRDGLGSWSESCICGAWRSTNY